MPNLILVAVNQGRVAVRRAVSWRRHWWHQVRRAAKHVAAASRKATGITSRTAKAGQRAASIARWSAVRRHGVQARALWKLSANGRAQRDRFALLPLENHLVRQVAGMTETLWVSPQQIQHSVRQITPANVVTFADLAPLLRPVSGEPTIRFVAEIVKERRPYEETALFRQIANGKERWRRVGTETIQLTTDNFQRYYEKCIRQVEFVAQHGLRPWDKSTAVNYDSDIAVLLSAHGDLVFLRRGTHRLGIAFALGLERIPVQIFMVAGPLLTGASDRPGPLLPWHVPAALRTACAGVQRVGEGRP